MQEKIIKVINSLEIDKWIITQYNKQGEELYFIGKQLDMNRSKEIRQYRVSVFVDFEEDGKKYTGNSDTTVSASMDEAELMRRIGDAKVGAALIKNEYYDLYTPKQSLLDQGYYGDEKGRYAFETSNGTYNGEELFDYIPDLISSIYDIEDREEGGINSSEIFLNRSDIRLITSTGIDATYRKNACMVEVVADWKNEKVSVEQMFDNDYGMRDHTRLSEDVRSLIENVQHRAQAKQMISIKDVPVVFADDSVKSILGIYVNRASAVMKYDGMTTYEMDKAIQGESVIGDKITIEMVPQLEGSTLSSKWDSMGYPLESFKLIEEGVLRKWIAPYRYASYLDVAPTGQHENFRVATGVVSIKDIEKKPYVAVISFSDLNVNAVSGNIGGEIRLAKYFDGEKTQYFTGGAVSTNISDIEKEMYFSKEATQINNYYGPKYLEVKGIELSV